MKLTYPLKDDQKKKFINAAAHYGINEKPSPELNELQKGGWFPIGMNEFWHAGVHFDGDRPVHAVAKGNIVAYRVTNKLIQPSNLEKTFEGAKVKNRKFLDFPISNNFILTKHLFKPPKGDSFNFYMLYMHLLPHQELSDEQKKNLPIFHQHIVSVKQHKKPDGAGLQLVDGHSLRVIIVMPKGSLVKKLDNNSLPKEILKRGYSKVEAHVYNTTFTGYADLNNDKHLKKYGDHYLIDTDQHPNPDKTGLNIRQQALYSSPVVDVAPFGAIIRFDESAGEITDEKGDLKSFPKPERYKKIKGYRHKDIEHKIEGYVYVYSSFFETEKRYDPEVDTVKSPNDLTIEKGDLLGWSSMDGTSDKKKTVHMELFIKTKKELDALRTYTEARLKDNTELNKANLLQLDEKCILSEKEIDEAYIKKDFMCDVSGMIKKTSKDGKEIITLSIQEAVADEEVAPMLRKMVAKHYPEWLPVDKNDKVKERLTYPPYKWSPEKYEAYKELYFGKLAFWDQLSGFPDEVYFFHPIKFIEHLKLLIKSSYYEF